MYSSIEKTPLVQQKLWFTYCPHTLSTITQVPEVKQCFVVSCFEYQFLICPMQEYAKQACSKTHPCGHPCGGVKNEETCLPCLHGCDKSTGCLKQDADDMCMICFTEALSAAPAVQVT